MDAILNQNILQCKNISVLLTNRESEDSYVESYRLNNIVYSNNKFWGKFSNTHCPIGHEKMGTLDLMSYAYNNFSPVVSTHCINSRMERFSSANAYANISFVSTGHFRKIWSNQQAVSSAPLHEAVLSGLKMKAKIESEDGYTYIVPIHTIVKYEDVDDFVMETEFDGFPEKLRHFKYIDSMESQFLQYLKKNPHVSYIHTDYEFDSEFFLTYFVIRKNEVTHRKLTGKDITISEEFACKSVEIWIEA